MWARGRVDVLVAITTSLSLISTWRNLNELWTWAVESARSAWLDGHPDRAEMLSADARYLDAELRGHGGASTLEVWPGLMHVFQALPRLAPEANAALLRVRDFLAALDSAAAHTDSEAS